MNLINKCQEIARDIYNDLGSGWSEEVYHNAFEVALRVESIQYESHKITPILYKGYNVGRGEVDILAKSNNEHLIVELKATAHIVANNIPQIKKYMTTLDIQQGLIINFPQEGKPKIECETLDGVEFFTFPIST